MNSNAERKIQFKIYYWSNHKHLQTRAENGTNKTKGTWHAENENLI